MDAAKGTRLKRLDFPITLAIALAGIATTAVVFAHPGVRDALIADDRVFAGQGWRLVTTSFVHATWGHLIRDLALIGLVGIAYEAVLPRWLFGLGLVVPVAAELLAHRLAWYCGLSGLSHALLAAALTYEAVRRRRLWIFVVCAIAFAKPLYELVTGASAFPMDLGAHVTNTPIAHAAGVAIGIISGARAARSSSSARASARRSVRRSSRAEATRGDTA
ncbi:MAG: rhomboid family intramembrane serine protease [Deltaproteobacteria bacterium]|nr:rhomboid family intramembrane serine protease [Deltaproteobacteria bacterium]